MGPSLLQLSKEKTLAYNYLREVELRRLHRRFGHPSVARLHKVLQSAGHPVEASAIEALTRVCHQCQLNAPRPARVKFTLHDECEFNYEVIVDIMYLEGNKPVLHAVDTASKKDHGSASLCRFVSSLRLLDATPAHCLNRPLYRSNTTRRLSLRLALPSHVSQATVRIRSESCTTRCEGGRPMLGYFFA
jgi:hypothetical protein